MNKVEQVEGTDDYVSVIGTSYLYPIASLLDALLAFNPKGPNEVQASSPENGYSVSIIVLAVLLIESFVNRAQYLLPKTSKPKNPYKFVESHYPDSGWVEKIRELSVLRDLIAHNHIWEATYGWGEEIDMKLVKTPIKQTGYGDGKFDDVVDLDSRLTKSLKLNVFPTKINYLDVKIVLKTTVDFLLFLESQDLRIVNISSQHVRHKGKLTSFVGVVNGL